MSDTPEPAFTSEYTPLSYSVDALVEFLNTTLASVVEQHGDIAKPIAWDIMQATLKEFGHLRVGGTLPIYMPEQI